MGDRTQIIFTGGGIRVVVSCPDLTPKVSGVDEEQKLGIHWGFDIKKPCPIISMHTLDVGYDLNLKDHLVVDNALEEKAIEVYHDENYKSRRWLFPSYNFTVSVIWSPFLTQAAIFEDINGVSTSEIELHLDKLDKNWTEQYKSLDYMIIAAGKWFIKTAIYYEKDTILGCHYCPKRNLTELGFNFAYRKVIRNVFDYIISSNHKGMIFYRTTTPDHFEELDEFEKASAKASEKRVNLKLLDVTPLSLLRPDGHPGPYRFFQPFAKDKNATIINDCLHWCLPGPIDSWNDLLMEMVVNG
ncbi:UNVERIFIED_CONTAM: protein trichome birefringence-like 23 [Sesamum latifolium]|uniref:Protein trichome birefringence-like 23 n=1 Tax=Sesamum latifolium TaxID=2727402 RepID=A0AAW2SM88_9LAMI